MGIAADIRAFWQDLGPEGWYKADAAVDATIRDRFHDAWVDATEGGLGPWLMDAPDCLSLILLTDQFSRNMFRDEAAAFATDPLARAATKAAIAKEWDLTVPEPMRQFFYLPLTHSENLIDQDRGVALMAERMPDTGAPMLLHARAHRQVIRTFARFPFRNAALGRVTTQAEAKFLAAGGYGAVVRALQSQAGSPES